MKRLIIVRHAEAEKEPLPYPQWETPLSARGRQQALNMARKVLTRSGAPDLILTSPAIRAQQTAAIFASSFPAGPPVITDKDLYESESTGMLEVLSRYGNEADSVLIVGHNPGVTDLGMYLLPRFFAIMPFSSALSASFTCKMWNELNRMKGNLDFFMAM